MARRPTVLVDCDGVLADFVGGFLKVVNGEFATNYKREDITHFDIEGSLGWDRDAAMRAYLAIDSTPGFAAELDVLPGAVDGIRRLQEVAEVYVVTSPWWSHPTWMHDRTTWLYDHLGIRAGNIVHTSAKHLVRGDMLIDDKTSTCEQWQAAWPDGLAVQWETPHNRLDSWNGFSASSWETVLDYAEEL